MAARANRRQRSTYALNARLPQNFQPPDDQPVPPLHPPPDDEDDEDDVVSYIETLRRRHRRRPPGDPRELKAQTFLDEHFPAHHVSMLLTVYPIDHIELAILEFQDAIDERLVRYPRGLFKYILDKQDNPTIAADRVQKRDPIPAEEDYSKRLKEQQRTQEQNDWIRWRVKDQIRRKAAQGIHIDDPYVKEFTKRKEDHR